jgi:hypothetical protein
MEMAVEKRFPLLKIISNRLLADMGNTGGSRVR